MRPYKWLLLAVAVALVAISSISAGPPEGAGPPDGTPGLIKASQVANAHAKGLLDILGIEGVGVGLTDAGVPAVAILLESEAVAVPSELDGVPVVTLVTGKIYALCHKGGKDPKGCGEPPPDPTPDPTPEPPSDPCLPRTGKARPACIGTSTGHPSITAGTIGGRVTDGASVYALSNNHVYAASNSASIGDAVIQPGTFDGGSSPADDLGNLSAFVEILFDPDPDDAVPGPDNAVDAAIAVSTMADLGNATPSDGYGTPKSTTITAYPNQKVKKYGRTTGETTGKVFAINATVDVGYGGGLVARFVDQIVITPGGFSAGGDSGSLVVVDGKGKDKAEDRKPVGLLFAGSALSTIASPIDTVLASLTAELGPNVTLTIDGE